MSTQKHFITLLTLVSIGHPLLCKLSNQSSDETLLWKHMSMIQAGKFCGNNPDNALCKEASRKWVEAIKKMPPADHKELYADYFKRVGPVFDSAIKSYAYLLAEVEEEGCAELPSFKLKFLIQLGLLVCNLSYQKGALISNAARNVAEQEEVWQAAENLYKEVQSLEDTVLTDDKPADEQ